MRPQILVLKGFLLINFPIILVWLALPIVGYTITKGKSLPFDYLLISSLSAFVFTWIWWSITSMRWQIKALNTTKYPVELEQRASEAALIFARHHFFQQKRVGLSSDKKKLETYYTTVDLKDSINTIELPINIRYDVLSSLWFLLVELVNFLFPFLIGLFLATNYATGQLFSNIGFGIIVFTIMALFINMPFIGKIDLIPALWCVVRSVRKEEIAKIDQEVFGWYAQKQISVRWENIHNIVVNPNRIVLEVQREARTTVEIDTRGIDSYMLQRVINKQLEQEEVEQYFGELVSLNNGVGA